MSIKLDQARRKISSLNAAFRARELLDPRFYRQLESAGFQPEKCVLVGITPDGAETYFGTLIRQDGRVFDFDIALAAPAHSEWTEITDTFLKDYRRLKKGRPWLPSIVAYDAFLLGTRVRGPVQRLVSLLATPIARRRNAVGSWPARA